MILSHERFLAVLSSLRETDAVVEPEQRKEARLAVRSSVLIAPCAYARTAGPDPEPGAAYAVRVHDLSPRGIAVQHFQSFAKGAAFVLELPERGQGGDVTHVRIFCRVTHCRTTA